MAKQMDRGGAQPTPNDMTRVLNQLLLSQRQSNMAVTSSTSSGMPTKRGQPARTK